MSEARDECPHCGTDLTDVFGTSADSRAAVLVVEDAPPKTVTVAAEAFERPGFRCLCGVGMRIKPAPH